MGGPSPLCPFLSVVLSSVCVSRSGVSYSLRPHGPQPPGSSVHGVLQARILEWVATPPPGHLPDPGVEPSSFLPGPLPCWNWTGSRFVEPPPPASPGTALLDTPLTGGACPSGCFKPLFVGVPGHVWPAGSGSYTVRTWCPGGWLPPRSVSQAELAVRLSD